jgi:hypothetical protein
MSEHAAIEPLKAVTSGRRIFSVDQVLFVLHETRAAGQDIATVQDLVDQAFESASDTVLGDIVLEARVRKEATTLDLDWIEHRAVAALFNRAVSRRSDEKQKIAIPHERLDISLEPKFSTVEWDVDVLETVRPMLKPEEQAKLLKVEEAHDELVLPLSDTQKLAIESAIALIDFWRSKENSENSVQQGLRSLLETRKVPRRVVAGSTNSIDAIARRYAGSNVEQLITSARKVSKVRDDLRITPRASTEPKTVSGAA